MHDVPAIVAGHVMGSGSSIVQSFEGRPRKGGAVAVFAAFPGNGLHLNHVQLLDALNAAGVDVVVVSNATVSETVREAVCGKCIKLIFRANRGRDFGAYKDGVLSVLRDGIPDRLLLLNDSCFYDPANTGRLIEGLLGPEPYIASNENFAPYYHATSFAMSFSRTVADSRAFRDFWRNYVPVNARNWAIKRGELSLSVALLRAGYVPKILFNWAAFLDRHAEIAQSEWQKIADLLPRRAIALANGAAGRRYWPDPQLTPKEYVSELLGSHSQAHFGAFVFAKYLNSPIIKRDLLVRGVYGIGQMHELARSFPEAGLVVDEFKVRRRLGPVSRRMFAKGFI